MATHLDGPVSTDEKPSEELMQLFWGKCTCHYDYTKRNLTDPQCVRCNYEEAALLSRCLASRTATVDGALREALEWAMPSAREDVERYRMALSGPSITQGMMEEYEQAKVDLAKAEQVLSAVPTHDASKIPSLNLPYLRSVMMQVKVSPMDDAGIYTVYLGKLEVAAAVRELEEISIKSPPTNDAVRDAALEEAAKECERHAAFCKDEAHKGGAWDYLMTRNDEATYNAERIRRLKSPTVEKKA